MMPTSNNILRRAGGKTQFVKYLLPLITGHTCYVEVFAGGAALLRAKPKSKVEILNDTDEVIVNAFRCVRYHPAALSAELDNHLKSRATFVEYRRQPGLTHIQRAARWLYLNALSFGGDASSWGLTARSPGWRRSLGNLQSSIAACHKRLADVAIEKLDWRRCLELYDSDETFFFLDPPYTESNVHSFAAFTPPYMQELSAAIKKLKGGWVLTVNDSPENRKLFAFGKQKVVSRWRGIANRCARDRKRCRELIVCKLKRT